MSATTLSPKSMPDVTPPAVITFPSLTVRAFSCVAPTRGRSSAKAQCVVARRSLSKPATPRMNAPADASVAWEALRKCGHVALMRHSDAPGGAGDPVGFKLDDCSTQRNLSGRGRADAVAIGAQIRANGVSFTRIISSPWCRCVETAKLMDLGPRGHRAGV